VEGETNSFHFGYTDGLFVCCLWAIASGLANNGKYRGNIIGSVAQMVVEEPCLVLGCDSWHGGFSYKLNFWRSLVIELGSSLRNDRDYDR
jgi:hypothetical protein